MSNQMVESREFLPAAPDAKSDIFSGPRPPQNSRKKKKGNSKNKKRFSDEQIKLLESIFKSETKLEPKKKLQVASQLGLQPRQVAIWFQNRRARWKSKQIEQEYKILRANYENLATRFESLKNERQSLIIQLQRLSELLGEPCKNGNMSSKSLDGSNTGISPTNVNANCEPEAHPGPQNTELLCSQNGKIRDAGHSGDEEGRILHAGEYTYDTLPLPEKWNGFDSFSEFNLSCSTSQLFNFWA